jgi:hypothetical protein
VGVDEGVLDAYYVLRLTTPYTTGSDFDYTQVIWFKNRPGLAALDGKVWEARAKKAGYSSFQVYLDKVESLAKPVRSAWRTSMARIGDIRVGSYIRTANWQVEPEYRQETLRFLEEYTMPLAKGRISNGGLQGWGLTRPAALTGSDDEAGFSFAVSNVTKDSDTMVAGPGTLTEELFNKAVPGKSYVAYIVANNKLIAHRKVVMTRISEVVALAGALPTITP